LTSDDPYDHLVQDLPQDESEPEDLPPALGGLEGEALQHFREDWRQLGTGQRADLVARLRKEAQENLALDFAAVCAIASEDSDPAVRTQAFQLAGEDASPGLFELCLRGAADDPDPEARIAATEALGAFTLEAQSSGWPDQLQDRAQRALLANLHSERSPLGLRRAALLALAYLTTTESEAEIRNAYLDPSLHLAALEAMGRNCQETWLPYLESELESDDDVVRLEAVLACLEMEAERLVPSLIERLDDPTEAVRLAAIHALGTIGGDEAESALREAERNADPSERAAFREARTEAYSRDDFFGLRELPDGEQE